MYVFSLPSAGALGWGKIRYENGLQCFGELYVSQKRGNRESEGARTSVRRSVGERWRLWNFAGASVRCSRSCGINPAPLPRSWLGRQTRTARLRRRSCRHNHRHLNRNHHRIKPHVHRRFETHHCHQRSDCCFHRDCWSGRRNPFPLLTGGGYVFTPWLTEVCKVTPVNFQTKPSPAICKSRL
jgi:hypothetical protein